MDGHPTDSPKSTGSPQHDTATSRCSPLDDATVQRLKGPCSNLKPHTFRDLGYSYVPTKSWTTLDSFVKMRNSTRFHDLKPKRPNMTKTYGFLSPETGQKLGA